MVAGDEHSPTHTLAEVTAAIVAGEVGHLTSDVFDTVVWRAVARPEDLFLTLARLLRDEHGVAIGEHEFLATRTRAEARARRTAWQLHGTPECTFEEIWDEMPVSAIPRSGGRAAGLELELLVESDHLRLHPGVVEVFATARRHGVGITLVSDIYVSSAQLRRLLDAAGLDLSGIDVVTSSERRRNKWDGLLDDVFAAHGGPARCLHLGDNPGSDVIAARRAGAGMCHVALATTDDAVASTHRAWERRSRSAGTDGGRTAVVRETFVAAGATAASPSYQFGVAAAGPVMVGFAEWVAATTEEIGAGATHCLLREGARIAELIDVVRPDAPERVLVHASRWGVMRAAVISGTRRELERALSRRADLRAEHLVEAFGCDLADAVRVLGGAVVPRTELATAFDAIAADGSLIEQIVGRAAALRRNALVYLERQLRLDGPLVLSDIGWGATIQEGITDILRSAGHDQPVTGLYALLSPSGVARRGEGADVRCYLPLIGPDGSAMDDAAVAVRHPEFLERINTPQLGTLLEFGDDGTPVCRPDDHDPISESLRLAQRGVVDFCRTWQRMVGVHPEVRATWLEPAQASAALSAFASTIGGPDPRLAAAIGTWSHDDVAGSNHEPLAGAGFERWVRYANGVDAADITMHEVFWVAGAASAAGSPVAFQLAALADGAHPDSVCPPSPTGVARIALFPPGSPLASAQRELTPRQGGAGWMLLQLQSPVPGLRSIRIDLGDVALLAEIADAEIRVTGPSGELVVADGPEQLRRAGTWVSGRWLSDRRAAAGPGGHLLVDVPAGDAETVDVSIAFRTSPLTPDEQRRWLPEPLLRVNQLGRRVRHRLGR
jgi:FMN phosphatase YigB (HAD superfamily)